MIKRPKPERFRLRRTMMFMNAQKPGLIKDAYIYGCDSIMLDLEDAVAENQKDAARFSLYHALTTIDYGSTEVIVRINGLDTPHGWLPRNLKKRIVSPIRFMDVPYLAAFFFFTAMKTGLTSSAMHTIISTKAIGCSVGLNIARMLPLLIR